MAKLDKFNQLIIIFTRIMLQKATKFYYNKINIKIQTELA